MANEHTFVFELEPAIPFVCADATGIEKGTLVKLSGSFAVAAQGASNDAIAGVTKVEKIASNGITSVSVVRRAIAKCTISGSVTNGDALIAASTANMLKTCPNASTLSGANIVGRALESGTTGQTILYELNPYTVKNN